jgi:hypothetical protein
VWIFLPLFGSKAPEALRARIKVIPTPGATASNNQIRSLVVAAMNAYFDLANWDFGATFYFSELAAYIHSQIGTLCRVCGLGAVESQQVVWRSV